jgi:acyl carrier protein
LGGTGMVLEKIKELLADQLEVDIDEITPDTNVIEDLGADSLDIAELIVNIEDEYNIVISEDELQDIVTVGSFAEFVENLISE